MEQMATAAPERSLTQRRDALAKGNGIRVYRGEVKRDLKAGRRTARELLTADDPRLASMKVFDLLLAMPKWGRVKVNRLLVVHRISSSKTVGGLSRRQRDELLRYLPR